MLGSRVSIAFALRLKEYIQTITTNRFKTTYGTLSEEPIPTEVAFRFSDSSYVGIIHWWFEDNMPFTPNEMAAMMAELYAYGVFKAMGMDVKVD